VNHYQAPDEADCDFAGLLEAVHDVPGIERIRFASPHPRHVTDRLVSAIRDLPKVCKHLHLPVQSGSTRVLAAMRRRYSRESYLALVARLREEIPALAVTTDMIVGFPGETAEEFDETLSLTAAVRYHSMFSFKCSERPDTLAAKLYTGTPCPRTRRPAASSRCSSSSGRFSSSCTRPWWGRRSTSWLTRPAAGAPGSCRAARAATPW
jgi:tRNA-2-methylthio-N6-dimethylallyladenosine synthase